MMWKFERFANRIAVKDEYGTNLSYLELSNEGKALAEAAGGRCLIFCLCENTVGSFFGYAAFLENGIVPLMLNSQTDSELLNSLYQTYQPAYLWLPADSQAFQGEMVYERFGYRLLRTPFGKTTALHEDLALLLTTSGSTGSPKFVRQSYRNIEANTRSIVEYLALDKTERPITTLPMNYTYGLSIINSHLWVGATILMCDRSIMQREFWDFFRKEEATSFGGVPYTYEMLSRMRFTRMKLPSLRTMTQAGGKLLTQYHQQFAEWSAQNNVHFIVMYGQCEATARMAYLPWHQSLRKIGTMGIPIPGGRFELIGTDGEPVTENGTTGELRYYGENVTLGYAECAADLKKGDERFGVLDTGDMAQRDDDGYYTIVGRKKRFLKLFGNRVNLDETERLLKAAFPDYECACGGIDDHLYIFSVNEKILAEMRAYLSEKTGLNPAGFTVIHLPQIPKSDSGKTLYRELEVYYD